jgi:hypothetical protein
MSEVDPAATLLLDRLALKSSWRRFSATARTPSGLHLVESDDRLAVIVKPPGSPLLADRALAWGLAYCGDRELVLGFPASAVDRHRLADGARARLWAFTVQAVMFVYDPETGDTELIVPYPKALRLERVREPRADGMSCDAALRITPPVLPAWAEGLDSISRWCQAHGLQRADRKSYVAWHHGGRKIVQVDVRGKTLSLSVGVHAKVRPERFKAAASTGTFQAASKEELDALWAGLIPVAEQAIEHRSSGGDAENQEHRLQAALANQWGLAIDQREFPARRPYGGSGFIDLLRVNGTSVEVVETKLGFDERLLLQGIDYVVWAQGNADLLRDHFKLVADPKVKLRLIVGNPTTQPALLARWAGQRQHLSHDLDVEWQEMPDWGATLA